MASLDFYIRQLDGLSNNLEELIEKIFNDSEGKLLGMVKLRLYQKGLDSNLISLGVYSPSTVVLKKKKGQPSTKVTLRDEGLFYEGMTLEYSKGVINGFSTDEKYDLLVDIYGENIVGLSDYELNFFIDYILEPGIQKELDSLSDNIDLDA